MTTATVTKTKKPATIGAQIDALTKLKADYKAKSDIAAEAEAKVKAAEAELLKSLQEQGQEKAGGKTATVSIRTSQVGNVTDWEALWAFIHKKKYGHLLQRRLSDPAVREIFEREGKVPGVELFTKTSLGYTAVK